MEQTEHKEFVDYANSQPSLKQTLFLARKLNSPWLSESDLSKEDREWIETRLGEGGFTRTQVSMLLEDLIALTIPARTDDELAEKEHARKDIKLFIEKLKNPNI